MTTQNRLVFDCLTQSTDVRARNNVLIGNSLLDHIFYQKRLERHAREMLEIALFSGTAFLYVGWKQGAMRNVDEDGNPAYGGDLEAIPLTLLDVGMNPFKTNFEEQDSFKFRRVMNKYELAATYKDKEEDILNLPNPEHEDRVMLTYELPMAELI